MKTRFFISTITPILICISLFFSFLFPVNISGQNISGNVKYTITHNWVKKYSSIDYIDKAEIEKDTYVWANEPEWVEISTLSFSPEASLYNETGETKNKMTSNYTWRKQEYTIYRNFKENKSYDLIRTLNKLYVIEDSIKSYNWKILNEMREISGHICMNASIRDSIKNQTIIAWFALDIPVSAGPDRYTGLPGLILEININKGALVISAETITINQEPLVVEKPVYPKRVKLIKESDYYDLISKYIADSKKLERVYFWGLRY
ncbi:MAG: hypothetical protein CVU05_07340 [Bacteroidetes bacterium HGW-Bacteroidetes-21]|nr:MAG: hypothetical protein CVU05_07340 [Bacteroidetes bacterium HGW-Bacteroidetes-21]